ncbi:MAG: endopeptidase La [Oscillospiraceae bacterium]|nr:endopeptidase La [Oscillospiraceae bacterium]
MSSTPEIPEIPEIPKTEQMPLLALRGLVVFPHMLIHFDVGRDKSVKALEEAVSRGMPVFAVAQKDALNPNPEPEDVFKVGTVSRIKQVLKLPNNSVRVLIEGSHRATLTSVDSTEPIINVTVKPSPDKHRRMSEQRKQAMMRHAVDLFEDYVELAPRALPEILLSVREIEEVGRLADYIAQTLALRLAERQSLIEELNPITRLERIGVILMREIETLHIELQIQMKLRGQLVKNQRDYYLREQLKTIQEELGESEDDPISEAGEYGMKIKKLKLDSASAERLTREVSRLSKLNPHSPDVGVIRTYLDTVLELPWNTLSTDRLDLERAKRILEREHFGLDKVKERVLEFLAVKRLAPSLKGQILCLIGPPGVGKTSVASSVAHAMGRKMARISLGGVRDEADIRGHRKTYVGAMPGRIITGIRQAGSRNPVLLLDEIDKMGNDFRGDPAAALLEVLDSEQNHAFRDHYIEIPFDLSDVLFITTANTTQTIPRALLDRMEIIELTSYTDEEKLQIAKRHLLPKQLKKHGLTAKTFKIHDDAIRELISGYTRESGVRTLERELAALCRKSAHKIASGVSEKIVIKRAGLEELAGVRRFKPDKPLPSAEAGVAAGLAWTRVGGEILHVECGVTAGTGKVELTGNLGDIMKESARAALSYIRSRADTFGLPKDFYKKNDLHVHFPESAIPKDGPSAGITMAAAMVSALTGKPIRNDIAMTGEITIRGRVLSVGGLKEKTMAALRTGIKTVLIPADNEPDLADIDPTVKNALTFITASHMDEVLKATLVTDKK